jgi:UDP-glucuronate 4-epimerase
MKSILITGGAGFIGSHLAERLLQAGWQVTCIDNFDTFYNPERKHKNIASALNSPHYRLLEADIRDLETLKTEAPAPYDAIVHIAARAGVRPSILDPLLYQQVNVQGTQNMLELAKEWGVKQFVFASSSSVYGINPKVPWSEDDHVLMPISPYAATKVAGELLGHVYSHLYGIRFLALRFFTVYGPRQRPDLAIHKFTHLMLQGKPIPLYGKGDTQRDYTYVDDLVDGIRSAIDYSGSPYEVINLGSDSPVSLMTLVEMLQDTLKVKADIEFLPEQPGDVPRTWADVSKAFRLFNYRPKTDLGAGLQHFAEWIRSEEGVK